jgi:hypothetical protein
MQTATGVTNIWGGGAIGFTTTRFTQPPVVVCQIIRSSQYVFNSRPVYVYITYVNKDSFSYTVRGDRKPGDQVSWIAIGI